MLNLCYQLANAKAPSLEFTLPGRVSAMAESLEIEALFVKWGPMVLRRARSILGNEADAEEAMQEVFVRAMHALDSFEGRSQASSWLYRITTNLCLNRLRNQNRRKELRERHLRKNIARDGHAEQVIARELLLKVPEDAWAKAAVYVYVDGMTHQEAATMMGVSKRTIGNHLRRLQDWVSAQDGASIPIQPRASRSSR